MDVVLLVEIFILIVCIIIFIYMVFRCKRLSEESVTKSEYDEICSLTNPTVKKALLESFANKREVFDTLNEEQKKEKETSIDKLKEVVNIEWRDSAWNGIGNSSEDKNLRCTVTFGISLNVFGDEYNDEKIKKLVEDFALTKLHEHIGDTIFTEKEQLKQALLHLRRVQYELKNKVPPNVYESLDIAIKKLERI